MEIIKGQGCCAQDILIQNGFEVISSWYNNNIFAKNGQNYRISHPVWVGNCVQIEKIKEY